MFDNCWEWSAMFQFTKHLNEQFDSCLSGFEGSMHTLVERKTVNSRAAISDIFLLFFVQVQNYTITKNTCDTYSTSKYVFWRDTNQCLPKLPRPFLHYPSSSSIEFLINWMFTQFLFRFETFAQDSMQLRIRIIHIRWSSVQSQSSIFILFITSFAWPYHFTHPFRWSQDMRSNWIASLALPHPPTYSSSFIDSSSNWPG